MSQNRCIWLWYIQDVVKLYHVIITLDPILSSQWRPYTYTTSGQNYDHRDREKFFPDLLHTINDYTNIQAYQSYTTANNTNNYNNNSISHHYLSIQTTESFIPSTLAYCTGTARK